jgi:zinc transport system substrate-binding protein
MKKWLFLILFLSLPLRAEKISVLVTAAPYVEIVEAIGKEFVTCTLFVPEGVDLHNFEPSPKKMEEALQSSLWFTIGEPFEKKIAAALKGITVVNVRDSLQLPQETERHHQGQVDPHIWMSARLMQQQAETIINALVTLCPEHKSYFLSNGEILQKRLQELDNTIATLLKEKEGKRILTVHAAFGYFCRDYGLQELVVEHEGKEPSIRALEAILFTAKAHGLETVFYQQQGGDKIANIVAEKIGGKALFLNAISTHYFDMMDAIAHHFYEGCR